MMTRFPTTAYLLNKVDLERNVENQVIYPTSCRMSVRSRSINCSKNTFCFCLSADNGDCLSKIKKKKTNIFDEDQTARKGRLIFI